MWAGNLLKHAHPIRDRAGATANSAFAEWHLWTNPQHQAQVKDEKSSLRYRFVAVFAATYCILISVFGLGQMSDPFVQSDDYPALLLFADTYYPKTLSEGRWFNYLWHLRALQTPAWLNFQLYLIAWCLFSSAASLSILRSAPLIFPIVLSALMVLSPQMMLMSGWFNTLIPGMWLLACYAAISLVSNARLSTNLLVVFVPLSIQAYTPFPFLLLAIAVLREDAELSSRELVRTLAIFVASFVAGVVVIYAINYFAHGVFGVELHDWRHPTPAKSLSDAIANFSKVRLSMIDGFEMYGAGSSALSATLVTLFAASLLVLAFRRPLVLISVVAGLGLGFGVLILHAMQAGVQFPFRATCFAWFYMSAAILLAAYHLRELNVSASYSALGSIIAVSIVLAMQIRVHHKEIGTWQSDTRNINAQISGEVETIFVYGTHLNLTGIDDEYRSQMIMNMRYRLLLLSGRQTIMCAVTPTACPNEAELFDEQGPGRQFNVLNDRSSAFVRLSFLDLPAS